MREVGIHGTGSLVEEMGGGGGGTASLERKEKRRNSGSCRKSKDFSVVQPVAESLYPFSYSKVKWDKIKSANV